MAEMKEIRNNIITRSTDNSDSRIIEGYAIVFNSRSADLGGFYETINPDAITQETLNNSDILFLLDHNPQRGVLARSNKGNGSLELKLDEKGLYFRFEAPNSPLGEEVLEGIKRGDINKCSFAFIVEEDDYTKQEDGTVLRIIKKINRLYDCSVVYHPAYEETSVDTRGLEAFLNADNNINKIDISMKKAKRNIEELEEEIKKLQKRLEEIEDEKEVAENEETTEEEETKSEEEEITEEVEEKDCDVEDETEEKSEEEDEEETIEEKKTTRNNKTKKTINRRSMNKKFSLLKAINDIANNRSLDSVAQNVVAEGRSAANKAGITANGQIQIALEAEKRFEDTPNGILGSQNEAAVTYGGEAVPTETLDILGALRDRLVISELGAKMLTLSGNVELPIYSGASCTWESEIGEAKDGSGKFNTVKLTPKRLTATLPISKQFLIQSSESAEALLRQDLIDCIAEKLQKTIFGDGAGDDVTPAGLFNGVVADSTEFGFEEAVGMEETLENKNVYGEYAYVMAPATKAVLRTTPIDAGSGRMVMENNQVLGIDAYSTNSVVPKGVVLGNWSNFYLASFGALDITVDNISRAKYGQIELIVNAYFDYAVVRPDAFVKRILK